MSSPSPASSRPSSAVPSTPARVPAGWSLDSWTTKPIVQDVQYENKAQVTKVLAKLRHLPPLVCAPEIDQLRAQLKEVAEGKRFLLQGGDCAELFDYCSADPIENKLKVLLQMSLVLTWGSRIPVVRVARMAGQYAKPRSKPTEIIDGKEVLSFRGDNVNGFDVADRAADPDRLLGAYFHSAATLNYLRSLVSSGFADLHHPSSWDLNHVKKHEVRQDYQAIVNRLTDALHYMKTIGADTNAASPLSTVDMYVSHEALLLEYEACLTRMPHGPAGGAYNLGAHFVWIGDRTRQLDGAHVEYMRGLRNPIGVKVGPSMPAADLGALIARLDPDKEPGKVTLITRYGADKVRQHLPAHIAAVKAAGYDGIVVWTCDPMHGNTESAPSGHKTRQFDKIVRELSESLRIHKECGSYLGGVHLELTGDRVTECTGGSMELAAKDLPVNYQTYCDPRLNYEQALDVAFLVAKYHERERSSVTTL
ncbi:hypothetical protein GGF32_005978 [Allomyces javanicus]|nr:hypothetical protein GGF32_005978 [Allomyces javanicus]